MRQNENPGAIEKRQPGFLAIIPTRYRQTKLKHFGLYFMYRGVLIPLIVHEAWAIRFSVAKMLPHPDHMAAAA